jgi:hypothetical protein
VEGIAENIIFVNTPSAISVTQRKRCSLAHTMARADGPLLQGLNALPMSFNRYR